MEKISLSQGSKPLRPREVAQVKSDPKEQLIIDREDLETLLGTFLDKITEVTNCSDTLRPPAEPEEPEPEEPEPEEPEPEEQEKEPNVTIACPRDDVKNDAPAHVRENYTLAMEDTFSGNALDPNNWSTELVWGRGLTINDEEQYYVATLEGDTRPSPFSFNSAGNLEITASPIQGTKPVTAQGIPGGQNFHSGIIHTRDTYCFTHGYAEVCAKVPEADGAWPATWLLNCFYYNDAFAKNQAENGGVGNDKFNPEIDFMEMVNGPSYQGSNCAKFAYHYFTGSRLTPGSNYSRWSVGANNFTETNVGSGNQISSFNVFPDCAGNNVWQLPDYCPGFPLANDFHTYAVDWTPEYIHYYVDGQLLRCINQPSMVSDQAMYLLINFAVGGAFPFNNSGQLADPNDYPAVLEVEYARIYTL